MRRNVVVGAPHTYFVHAACALGQPLFAAAEDAATVLAQIEAVRAAFDARVFAYAVGPDRLDLVLRHAADGASDHDALLRRWSDAGGRPLPPARLQARVTSLAGLMQTLLQRCSRAWNRRRAGRGRIWSSRYRACLLADDAAVLAASAWIEGRAATCSSRGMRAAPAPVQLAPPPLRIAPDGSWLPSDEAPPGLAPPDGGEADDRIAAMAAALPPNAGRSYEAALLHGWALGRAESLTESLARLGRGPGRGRSRALRDLQDELGLCGVWG